MVMSRPPGLCTARRCTLTPCRFARSPCQQVQKGRRWAKEPVTAAFAQRPMWAVGARTTVAGTWGEGRRRKTKPTSPHGSASGHSWPTGVRALGGHAASTDANSDPACPGQLGTPGTRAVHTPSAQAAHRGCPGSARVLGGDSLSKAPGGVMRLRPPGGGR